MNAVDTNILIYCIDQDEPEKRARARRLVRDLRAAATPTVLLWQVLTEFVRYLRSTQDSGQISPAALARQVGTYRRLFALVMPTSAVLDHALRLARRHSLSHWDSMLLGACLEAQVDTLYTEDMGAPISYEGINLINPFS